MMVRYLPFTDCCRIPSEAEPYSPEIAEFAPLPVCGRARVPTGVADVPPELRLNSFSTIGAAVSRPPLVEEHAAELTEQDTVLITRSPAVKAVIGAAAAGRPPPRPARTAAAASNTAGKERRTIGMSMSSRFLPGNLAEVVCSTQCNICCIYVLPP